jgi:hypothetical protein
VAFNREPPTNGESITPVRGNSSESPEVRQTPGSRNLMLLASVAGIVVLGLLFALRHFFGESLPELTESSLDAAMTRWEKNGPASYDLDLEIAGRQPGVVHLEVRGGEVTVANRDGRPTPERTWDEWSVPGQFDTLVRELEMAADPQGEMNAPRGARIWLRAEFEPKFGYPRKFHRYASGGAIEMSWQTTAFTPK